MKKILLVLALFCALGSSAQPGYTYIAQRYQWLAGLFRALGLPAGDGPAAFQPGQAQTAGSVYYDSSGIDQGPYLFDGVSWVPFGGSALVAGEGMAITGDSIHLGGLINAPPPLFSQNRLINTNRKGLYFINGTISDLVEPGGISWAFGQEVFSPYQFISRDTVTANDVDPPTAAVPWSGIYGRRELYYPTGIFRTQKVFGHTLEMVWQWDDTLSLRTESGDYNLGLQVNNTFRPYGTGRQGIRASHGTGQNNSIAYAAPALLAVTTLDNDGSNYIKVDGHLSGVNSYLVGAATDTLKGFVYYTTGAFSSSHIDKVYAFAPGTRWPPPFADSAFLIFDTSVFNRNYMAGRTVLGPSKGTANPWASSDWLKVHGNVTTTDTLVLGAANQVTDTLGVDILLRRRTTGGVVRIRPDEFLAFAGGTPGLDNVLAVGQALTANRSTPTSAFQWDIASSSTTRTLGLTNTGVSGVGLFVSATNTLSQGIQADGAVYGANITSDNVPLRLNTNRGATANMMELNRTFDSGNGPDGMVGNIFEYNMENDAGTLTPVSVLQTTLDESASGNERASAQMLVKNNGVFETYIDMQTGGINRTNNNADTLATRAYARNLVTLSKGFMYDTLTVSSVATYIPRFYWSERYQGSQTNSVGSTFNFELSSGTGANASVVASASAITGATGYGYAEINTGTTSTGKAILHGGYGATNNNQMGKVDNDYYYRVEFKNVIINDLSDGTDTYKFWAGFGIDVANTNGIWFTYTHSENSGKWITTTYNNLTAEAQNFGGAAVAADTEYDLAIEYYNQTAKFYVDGTLIATHTTQVPAAASAMQAPIFKILKSASNVARIIYIDEMTLRITHENEL